MLLRTLLGVMFAFMAAVGVLNAQQAAPAIKRTILQKADVPGTNFEVVLGMAEIAPGVNVGRHTHAGPEQGTVTEGEMVMMIEGQPDKTIKAGESYQVPAGTIHDGKTAGKAAKAIVVYVVPKGQPLATPAK